MSCFINSICHASVNLPPVLNSYPKCDYHVLAQAETFDKVIVHQDKIEQSKQALLDQGIVKIRQQAAEHGADAIILTGVQGSIGDSQSIKSLRHPNYEIRYEIVAEFISVCQDNNALPTVYTPYNSSGIKQSHIQHPSTATSIKFETTIGQKGLHSPNSQVPLTNTISLKHGVYGAKTGMTSEQIRALFGVPDAELVLENDYSAWIYGREHQIIFAGNLVVAIHQNNNILSAEIKRRLIENLRFQQHDWRLDDTFGPRTELAKIKTFYQNRLRPLDQHRFALQNEHSQLILQFAPYLNVKNNSNQLLLVSISLILRQSDPGKIQLILPEPDSLQWLQNVLTKLATPAAHGPFDKPETAFYNRIKLRNGAELAVLTPELAVSYRNENIVGLTVTNILKEYAVSDIQKQLDLLNLPATKADFMVRFPESFDSLNQLSLYGEHSEITATYTVDDLIDSLHIRWY